VRLEEENMGPADSSQISYRDFRIRIETRRADGYPTSVLDSPGGEGGGVIPFGADEMAHLRQEWEAIREGSTDSEARAREIGGRMFEALFGAEVCRLFDFSRGAITPSEPGKQDRSGLRIRLSLDPKHPDLLSLCSLPWELLNDRRNSSFFVLDPTTPVVRFLETPSPAVPPPFKRPLRILAAISSPRGLEGIDLDEERRKIEDTWKVHGEVEVAFLPRATLKELHDAVSNTEYHVFHFMGHGIFSSVARESLLYFEDHDRRKQGVNSRMLLTHLRGMGFPRLVFLNACWTAETPLDAPDPFAGIAVGLVTGGVPAVLAMQTSVSNSAAVLFSAAVYHALACGLPLEQAVTEGRTTLHRERSQTLAWAAPVLFLRATTDALFKVPRIQIPIEEPSAPPLEKKLQTLQKSIYEMFDNIRLRSIKDYRQLNWQESLAVENEILERMAGLGAPAASLLNPAHFNGRFTADRLLNDSAIGQGLNVLHRKSAIYSDHSIVSLPQSWDLEEGVDSVKLPERSVDESIVALLLQHRPLIENGKMSIVPSQVFQRIGLNKRRIFWVENLGAKSLDLGEPWMRRHFSKEGRAFDACGTLVFEMPAGGALPLLDVLEIEDKYRLEYAAFQSRFLEIFDRLKLEHGGDDSATFSRALREVDEGIRSLDAEYEKKLRNRSQLDGGIASGALAVVLYGLGAEPLAFLTAAFSGSALSCVSFLPEFDEIPDLIRQSQFFVLWLLCRQGP